MNRRDFLTLAGSSMIVPGAFGRPSHAQGTAYPTVHRLTGMESNDFVDGRPCFSPDGQTVLFMRQKLVRNGEGKLEPGNAWFCTVPAEGGEVSDFAQMAGFQFTRPDWSWVRRSFQIAFCGISNSGGENSIYLLDVASRKIKRILRGDSARNRIFSYPSWYPGAGALCVTNYWEGTNSEGFTTPGTMQHLLRCELDGKTNPLTHPTQIWPGMSSVSQVGSGPGNLPAIAFAGEPRTRAGYNQDFNQIWIRRPNGSVFAVDGLQARAPWWSPDGSLIAFESNRETSKTGHENYQIFVQDPSNPSSIFPVTSPEMAVQHAKWSPDGSRLTFAYAIGKGSQAQGIAYVDLSESWTG